MKAIMISIQPKYVADILNGKKTIEIRKTLPKRKLPIDVYIYCTKDRKHDWYYCKELGCYSKDIHDHDVSFEAFKDLRPLNGKVVAKFTLNKVEDFTEDNSQDFLERIRKSACFESVLDLLDFINNKIGYAWHIDNLVVFDKPKELSEFRTTQKRYCEHCSTYSCMGKYHRKWCYKPLTSAPKTWCYVEV